MIATEERSAHDSFPLLEARPMDKVSFGHEQVEPAEKTRRVRGVFTSVASRYDLMNDLMSGGQHRRWKQALVQPVPSAPGRETPAMGGRTGYGALRLARRGAARTA